MNKFSHIDLRVNRWESALPFYEKLLPALGFTRTFHSANWRVFATEGELPGAAYFASTEDPGHKPNQNVIGFWADDQAEVDRIARLVRENGGTVSDGPRLFAISQSPRP